MKSIKNLALLFAAALIGLGASAQQAATPASTPAQTTTPAKQGTPPAKKDVPKADPVDASMKGPKGETVYTGPKGGKYYMDASGNKKLLKQDKPASGTPK